ncbi:uracil-5-carboxylate decarboxylase [Biscogniauxia marginata]|nr:uracil-5-carboxylate decarboxylase [Biscogniauxia marginata]
MASVTPSAAEATKMSASTPKVVDVHTHMYPPTYVELLESRKTIPLIRKFAGAKDPRYIILPAEAETLEKITAAGDDATSSTTRLPGRPVTSHFSSLEQKLHFMNTHGIDISVISLANPWLDFVASADAGETAKTVNQDFSSMCACAPGRLFFFATLPLTAPPETLLASIGHIRSLRHCRGVVLGTTGLGRGLDDAALVPVLRALAANRLPVFLHPHYGLPGEVWGPRATEEYGHVLPLALGFPMETTIAVARMYLAGVFDAVPDLRMLLAHSGGTLPFLAGRIESCVAHDGYLSAASAAAAARGGEGSGGGDDDDDDDKPSAPARRTIWQVLREQVYLDAVIYSEVGLRAAVDASGGAGRLLFGTDHPFFPPPGDGGDAQGVWESVTWNAAAVKGALGEGSEAAAGVMGGNAVEVLRLYEEDTSEEEEEAGEEGVVEVDSDREQPPGEGAKEG